MLQIFLLMITTLLTLSVDSFWNLWVSLELYSFILMPWLMGGEGKISKVHVFLYFLMQFLASIAFLVSSLTFMNNLCQVVLCCSLLMKLSCFPFHGWFVNILPHISWGKILVLISLSKMVPLGILVMFTPPQGLLWVLILGLILPVGGFNTSCLRSIIAYSSVAHSSWLAVCACLGKTLSLFYILSYFVVSLPLCFLFMMETMTNMKTILTLKVSQAQLLITLLVLSGIPPFLGFVPKFMVIQTLVQSGSLVEASVLGVLSILPVYLYFKTGMLSLGMKVYLEFIFSNSVLLVSTLVLMMSILGLIYLLLSFSLMSNSKTLICQIKEGCLSTISNGLKQFPGRNWALYITLLKESKSFGEVMSPLAYGV